MKNVPLGVVQQLLVHKSMRMTERYSHFAPGNFNDAFSKIDSIYGNSAGQQDIVTIQTESNSSDRVPNLEKGQPEVQRETKHRQFALKSKPRKCYKGTKCKKGHIFCIVMITFFTF